MLPSAAAPCPSPSASAIPGVVGLILLLVCYIDVEQPPNVLAVNLSSCAMLMGVGILFYARGTTPTGPARLACALAMLTGLAGPMVYAHQTLQWRLATEGRELQNVRAIAVAADKYAAAHDGRYPADIGVLLEQKYLTPQTLLSPFAATPTLTDDVAALHAKMKEADVLSAINAHCDYTYVGADLQRPATGALPPKIIVVYAREPVMRTNLALAFADGSGEFITLDQAESVLKASNAARATLGLPPLQQPDSVARRPEGRHPAAVICFLDPGRIERPRSSATGACPDAAVSASPRPRPSAPR